jgi:hypothetical protein
VSKISWCNYKGALLPESYSSGYNFIITVFLEIIFENNFNYGAILKNVVLIYCKESRYKES